MRMTGGLILVPLSERQSEYSERRVQLQLRPRATRRLNQI